MANGDKFIKTSRVYSRNLCIKHRAALKIFNLLTSFDEKMKEKNRDTLTFLLQKTKLKYVMMVPPVAKWSFILLFGKPFSCSKLLSKVFTKMINIAVVDIWEGMGAH